MSFPILLQDIQFILGLLISLGIELTADKVTSQSKLAVFLSNFFT